MVAAHNRHLSTALMNRVPRHVVHVLPVTKVTVTTVILVLHVLSIMEAASLAQTAPMLLNLVKMQLLVNVQRE